MNPNQSGAWRISASAGSGKTFRLTRLFLERALVSPGSYSGIVAITFTNKAANELKERIIGKLSDLASGKDEPDGFLFGLSDFPVLRERAAEVLSRILHDMDHLWVTTIDSFFQKLFSQLAYEAGLPPGLRTELDQKLVSKEVLAEGFRTLSPEVGSILIQNLLEGLEEKGKDWRPLKYLKANLIPQLFNDRMVSFQYETTPESQSDNKMLHAIEVLRKYKAELESEAVLAARECWNECRNLGLYPEKLNPSEDANFIAELKNIERGSRPGTLQTAKVYLKHQKGEFHRPPKSRKLTDEEKALLHPFILRFAETRDEKVKANFNLAASAIKSISSTRLLLYFRSVLLHQNHRYGRFLLGEVKYLLKQIIRDDDVPYLYERIGNKVHTLLIDEFQDTDQIQWKVILPFARTVVDNGGFFAVVGDVKQSIYGWRGGDSSLFKIGIDKSLDPIPVRETSLTTNFRSELHIVEFNNGLFSGLAEDFVWKLCKSQPGLEPGDWPEKVRRYYQDVRQEVPGKVRDRKAGFVNVRVRKRNSTEYSEEGADESGDSVGLSWIANEVRNLQDLGFKASEIAILVRSNSAVAEVLQVLDTARQKKEPQYDFTFTTASEGTVGRIPVFRFLIAVLKAAASPAPTLFEFEEIENLAVTLGLSGQFHPGEFGASTPWREHWLKENSHSVSDIVARFVRQIRFFGLDQKTHLQSGLLDFQNLLFRYLQQESARYPDFFQWWTEIASELEIPGSRTEEGIQVMTIHKAKGLDFGVVILPLISTGPGDSKALHDGDFWLDSDIEPWNAHPLLKGKATKELLKSDLGDNYKEDVFKRALENLNTFYVACTRPRQGLILDINLDVDIEKLEDKSFRLASQIIQVLENEMEASRFESPVFTKGEKGSPLMLEFQSGERRKLDIGSSFDSEIHPPDVLPLRFPQIPDIPWAEGTFRTKDAALGILVHKVLEKTERADQWERILNSEVYSQKLDSSLLEPAKSQLSRLFSKEEMKEWFSGVYRFFPEQQMLDAQGKVLRVDCLLISDTEHILLDYKTGEVLPAHENQIRYYQKVYFEASGIKANAYLVYTNPLMIKEVSGF